MSEPAANNTAQEETFDHRNERLDDMAVAFLRHMADDTVLKNDSLGDFDEFLYDIAVKSDGTLDWARAADTLVTSFDAFVADKAIKGADGKDKIVEERNLSPEAAETLRQVIVKAAEANPNISPAQMATVLTAQQIEIGNSKTSLLNYLYDASEAAGSFALTDNALGAFKAFLNDVQDGLGDLVIGIIEDFSVKKPDAAPVPENNVVSTVVPNTPDHKSSVTQYDPVPSVNGGAAEIVEGGVGEPDKMMIGGQPATQSFNYCGQGLNAVPCKFDPSLEVENEPENILDRLAASTDFNKLPGLD